MEVSVAAKATFLSWAADFSFAESSRFPGI
jgi:hypothetical protein